MWTRFDIWREIHSEGLYHAWCVGFGALMLLWPVLFYASGVNVYDSVWYWLTLIF